MKGKYPRYPAYKDSGVEWLREVPEHWETSKFKRLATICNGQDYKEVADDLGEYPVFGSGGEFARASNYLFCGESVLLGRKGTVDKPLYINGPFWVVDTMFYTKISKRAVPRYVFYSAIIIPFALYLTSTALPSMTGEALSSHLTILPPLPEQQAIATFLDTQTVRIDALIAEYEKLIALIKEKRQALISHAVTKGLNPDVPMKDSGVEWLGEVPERWNICKLSYRFFVNLGKMLDEKKATGKYPIPYLRNQDVQQGRILTEDLPVMDICPEEYERYTVKDGDLLVCEGGDVGRAAIWGGQQIGYQKALHRLRARSGDLAEFMYYLLMTAKHRGLFSANDSKATISHLTAEMLRSYIFPFPPLSEQKAIAAYLKTETAKMDALIHQVEQGIELLKEHRSTLISDAVTGKIDVREYI